MKARSPHAYFNFGQMFHRLQSCSKATTKAVLIDASESVKKFLEQEGLIVSSRVFKRTIEEAIQKIKEKEGVNLTDDQASAIRTSTSVLFQTVAAEALDQQIYIASPKRYDSKKLLDDVGSLFAKDVFDGLPEIAKFDFKEACNCILFERNTAGAFHLLRGTEDVVKHLYIRLSASTATPGNGTWGDYENALKTLPDKPPAELMEQLRHIRKSFRNPTQHPDKRYDLDEVQDMLNVCIDAVNRIAKVK